MSPMEKAALQHVAEELAYRRSTQARRDAIADRQARAAADRKTGHAPECTLMRCAAHCPRKTGGR